MNLTPEDRLVILFSLADPDAWHRIVPIGVFERFGRKVKVTAEMVREMAANFGQVPNTAIPVNAEHVSEQGKLADVVAVQARPDGLWARLGNFIDNARERIASGAFQYLSPEIVWGPVSYDGDSVSNVLTGLALTNLPFFGQETAIYTLVSDEIGGFTMPEETVTMPGGVFSNLLSLLPGRGQEPAQQPAPEPVPDEAAAERFAALEARLQAAEERASAAEQQVATLQAGEERAALVEKYGAVAALDPDLPAMLADLEDREAADTRFERMQALVNQQAFAAMLAEITGEAGGDAHGEGADPVAQFNAAVEAAMEKFKVDYSEAVVKVATERPELYKAYTANLPTAPEEK